MPSLDPARDTLVNVDARGAPVPSARFMGGREHALLARRVGGTAAGDTEPASVTETDAASDGVDADDADGLREERALARVPDGAAMLLPSIVSGSGPYPTRVPQWTIDEVALDDTMHAVVVARYLALVTATCLELVGARGPVAVEGPFAANRAYLHMLAAATGRPVETGAAVTGTAVGTAMLIEPPRVRPALERVAVAVASRARLERHAARWRRRVEGASE